MSVQTSTSAPSSAPSKSKHSRKRTHDQSSLPQSQSQTSTSSSTAMPTESGSPTKKPRRSLGNVKFSTPSSSAGISSTLTTSRTKPKESTADTNSTSPFKTRRSAFFLPLSPITAHSGLSLAGLCAEHISPLLLTYYPPLHGVILAYSDAVLSTAPPTDAESADTEDGTPLARSIDEYGTPFVWLTATFTLLAPTKGTKLAGYPSVFSEQHVGLLCYNLFNAHVGFEKMPAGWSWVPAGEAVTGKTNSGHSGSAGAGNDDDESGGYWVDGAGQKISLDDELSFTVLDFESVGLGAGVRDRGFLTLEGTMRDDEEDGEAVLAKMRNGSQRMLMSGGTGPAGAARDKSGKTKKTKSKSREKAIGNDY